MYSSSASPRTSRPARSQLFRSTISDPRAPRTPSPALSRHQPSQPPRAAAHVSARSAGATITQHHRAHNRTQTPPHAHRRTNESCHVRSCNDSMCGRPPSSHSQGMIPAGTPHNPPRPAAPHVSARSAGATVTQHHARAQPADASDATWSCTRSDTEAIVLESLPRPRGQYSLQLAPFFFYP